MIKAVIFDCFGVLTTEGWLPFKVKHFGNDPEKMQQATELNRKLDSGTVDYASTVQKIANLAGVSFEAMEDVLKGVTPTQELLDYIRSDLKSKYRIGILSNVAGNWLDSFFKEEDIKLFDVITLSYKSGILKPDFKAYQAIADRLLVAPNECVFIDDRMSNVHGARQAGMLAVLYKDFEQMKNQLERLLAADAKS
jgi:HAD superfamily hydrolase (TIGR01549 family)